MRCFLLQTLDWSDTLPVSRLLPPTKSISEAIQTIYALCMHTMHVKTEATLRLSVKGCAKRGSLILSFTQQHHSLQGLQPGSSSVPLPPCAPPSLCVSGYLHKYNSQKEGCQEH